MKILLPRNHWKNDDWKIKFINYIIIYKLKPSKLFCEKKFTFEFQQKFDLSWNFKFLMFWKISKKMFQKFLNWELSTKYLIFVKELNFKERF